MSTDKWKHAAVCAVISVCVMCLMYIMHANIIVASVAALLCVTAAGGGKEYGDMASPVNIWDWKDLSADLAGGAVGILVGMLLWL